MACKTPFKTHEFANPSRLAATAADLPVAMAALGWLQPFRFGGRETAVTGPALGGFAARMTTEHPLRPLSLDRRVGLRTHPFALAVSCIEGVDRRVMTR